MTKTTLVLAVALALGAGASGAGLTPGDCPRPDLPEATLLAPPVVQIAILLDTSNSMDGLIDQARSQLWNMVNELGGAHRHGRPAVLQVALYEYGNDRLSAQKGFVRRVLPFTDDLDRLSEELFTLTTNGGQEFCGTVIQAALDELLWSRSPADLRIIFIAGNEPFSQGPVDYRQACQRARRQGVFVNTIHCGPAVDEEAGGWHQGALLARGTFSDIDQGKAVVHVPAPQDDQIARLNALLNQTYVPYGAQGPSGQSRQVAQDDNAAKYGMANSTERALTKANHLYSNAGWDLVDAARDGKVKPEALPADQLPKEMRGLDGSQRRAYLEEKARARRAIQAEIMTLNEARQRYLAALGGRSAGAEDTLDVAMREALREQAACEEITLR